MTAGRLLRRGAALWWVALAGAVVLQLVVLYVPRAPSTGGVPQLDKVIHVGVFAAVAVTGVLAGLPVRWLVGALLAHAVVSELIQWLALAHRDGDWRDSIADSLGTLAGAAVALRLLRLLQAPGMPGRAGRGSMAR